METVLIIVAVVLVVLVIAWLVMTRSPQARAKREERRLEAARGERAGRHREVASDRQLRAEAAEKEAQRARADAELHETKAKMHDEGVADHELEREPEPGERRRR
jgi:type II secretory pathway component PulM